jgi:hypothetical protein
LAPSLFGGLSGTMGPSDIPSEGMPDVRLLTCSDRPIAPSVMGTDGTSRSPCKEFPRIRRVFDSAGPECGSRISPCPMLPSAEVNSVGVPVDLDFGAGWLVCVYPCQRFACRLTATCA